MAEFKITSWQERKKEMLQKENCLAITKVAKFKTLGCSRNRRNDIVSSPEEEMKREQNYDIVKDVDDLG